MIKPELRKIIEEQAAVVEIDPDLVEAFCAVESSYNPKATRYEPNFYVKYISPMVKDGKVTIKEGQARATSYGLMQIMGQVAREKGFKGEFIDLFDPATNLKWALKHLKHFIKKYSELGLDYAIASYNAGSPRIVGNKFVNQVYVDHIFGYLKQIKEA